MKSIPKYVLNTADILCRNNFEAYLVGGSLRDILLDKKPKDYDIATNATPEQMSKLFKRSIMTGAKFGTVVVLALDKNERIHEVEVTTYRSEKDYVGGRWPSHIEFTSDIYEDLSRRDFTINSMALDLSKIQHSNELENKSYHELGSMLLDPYDGKGDLKRRVIKAVGNPEERFKEDGLRCMRACRLASVLSFEIERNTFNAIKKSLNVASMISMERIRDEFIKMIEGSIDPSIGLEYMRKSGLTKVYIPELLEGVEMYQNRFHEFDVYTHLLHTVDVAPKEIRIAALFHDIGKPRCKDGETFYGHDRVGAEMTRKILKRFKFPKRDIEKVSNLVRWHMFYVPHMDKTKSHEERKELREKTFKKGWSDSAIRRLINNVGGEDNIDDLLKLRVADVLANPKTKFDPDDVRVLSERINHLREQESLISTKDLKINGYDLMQNGIPEGPTIGEVMDYLLEKVTDDITLNEKSKLMNLAEDYYNNKLGKDNL